MKRTLCGNEKAAMPLALANPVVQTLVPGTFCKFCSKLLDFDPSYYSAQIVDEHLPDCWFHVPAKVHMQEVPIGSCVGSGNGELVHVHYLISSVPSRLVSFMQSIIDGSTFFAGVRQSEDLCGKVRGFGWHAASRNPYLHTASLRRDSMFQDLLTYLADLNFLNEASDMKDLLESCGGFPNLQPLKAPDVLAARIDKFGPNMFFAKDLFDPLLLASNIPFTNRCPEASEDTSSGSVGSGWCTPYNVDLAEKAANLSKEDGSLNLLVVAQRAGVPESEKAHLVVAGRSYPIGEGIAVLLDSRTTPHFIWAPFDSDVPQRASWYSLSCVKRFGA